VPQAAHHYVPRHTARGATGTDTPPWRRRCRHLAGPLQNNSAAYLRSWLDEEHSLAPKTKERYRELAELQIIPHLGATVMQRLKPHEVRKWHNTLLKTGAKNGRRLSAQTVIHAHRVLHRALQRAVEGEELARNVASIISPSKVEEEEIEILTEDSRISTSTRRPCGSSGPLRRPTRDYGSKNPRPSRAGVLSRCRQTPWRSCASTAASCSRPAWHSV
jgi:hypothetical protein